MNISLADRRLNLEFSKPEYFGGPYDTSFPFVCSFIHSEHLNGLLALYQPVIETRHGRVYVTAPIACCWSELPLTSTTG